MKKVAGAVLPAPPASTPLLLKNLASPPPATSNNKHKQEIVDPRVLYGMKHLDRLILRLPTEAENRNL